MDDLRALPPVDAEKKLSGMKRPELQKLAKEAGVKANVKSIDIIASLVQLLKHEHQERSEAAAETVAEEAAPAEAEAQTHSAAPDGNAAAAGASQQSSPETPVDATAEAEQAEFQAAPEEITGTEPGATTDIKPASAATAPPASPLQAAPEPAGSESFVTVEPHATEAPVAAVANAAPLPAPTTSVATPPAAAAQPSPSLIAEARAMAEQVRTASKRPKLCTPGRTPARVSLAASALGNRLRSLNAGTPGAANVPQNPPRSILFDAPASPAAISPGGSAASSPAHSDDFLLRRGSSGADAALAAAMSSVAPDASHDLSPGLLTMSAENVPAGTTWQGATEAQLREMERAWDDYTAGSPGWRAPSPATVAAKSASLAAAGFTTIGSPLPLPKSQAPLAAPAAAAAARTASAAGPKTPARAPLATPGRKPFGRLQANGAGNGNAYPKTPKTMSKPSKQIPPSPASRIPPPTPTGGRATTAGQRSAIPRPSPGNIKGPGRAAAMAAQRPPGAAKSQKVEEALAARRAAAAARWQQ